MRFIHKPIIMQNYQAIKSLDTNLLFYLKSENFSYFAS